MDIYTASPAFFETLGIPIQRGREFQLWETSAVIVSQRLARAFWPRQEPIGKVLAFPGGQATVAGVARDVDALRFGGSEHPALYRPWRLHPVRNVMSVRFEAGAATGAAAAMLAMLAPARRASRSDPLAALRCE